MGFFRNLFGKQETSPAIPVNARSIPVAPPRRIGYDSKLIDSLLHDHAELGRVFGLIGEAHKAGHFDEISLLLVQFKSRLEAHLLSENVLFYNYLEQSLASDAHNVSIMRDFRREMNGIARGVIDFVKKYQSSHFTPEERRQFAVDYEAVGKILEQRLDSEENNLYPLYMPS